MKMISLIILLITIPSFSSAQINMIKPKDACSFLNEKGLFTNEYRQDENVFYCNSPYYDIGNSYPLSSNIAYYVEGNKDSISILKLVLNVNKGSIKNKAHNVLLNLSSYLLKKATNNHLPDKIRNALLEGRNESIILDGARLSVFRINWPTNKGYEVHFVLQPQINAEGYTANNYFEVEPFVVNLADPQGRRYLKLALVLEGDVINIDYNFPRIKDSILLPLSSKTYSDLDSVDDKILLKNQIAGMINKITGKKIVKDVFFTEFVVQ